MTKATNLITVIDQVASAPLTTEQMGRFEANMSGAVRSICGRTAPRIERTLVGIERDEKTGRQYEQFAAVTQEQFTAYLQALRAAVRQ